MNTPPVSQIKFETFQIRKTEFIVSGEDHPVNIEDELSIQLNVSSELLDDNLGFYCNINLTLKNLKGTLQLDLESRAKFRTNEIIDSSYLKHPMVRINAPAIFFPFVRAYINTLSVNAGHGQIILPAINFAKMAEENQ